MKFKDKNSIGAKLLRGLLWVLAGIASFAIGILFLLLIMKLLMGTVKEIKPFW